MRRRASAVLLPVALVAAGCSTVHSADLHTSGFRPYVEVAVTGQDAQVSVRFSAGGLTTVRLEDGDRVVATGGGHETTLSEHHILGVYSYTGTLGGVSAPGTEVTVALRRGAGESSAPRSVVRLPEPIALTGPAAGATFSRAGDDIVVRVDRPGRDVLVRWDGPCVRAGERAMEPDRATLTLVAPLLEYDPAATSPTPTPSPGGRPATCDLRLRVERRAGGTLDPVYRTGSLVALTSAEVVVRSTP
jgi:hypothetical protein